LAPERTDQRAGSVTYNTNMNNIIEGNNGYTGGTTVGVAGTIYVGNDNAFGNGGR